MRQQSPFISARSRRGGRRPIATRSLALLALIVVAAAGAGWSLSRSGGSAAARTVEPRPAAVVGGPPVLGLFAGVPRLESPVSASRRTRRTPHGTGRLHVVPGTSPRSGSGLLQLYAVEVEGGLGLSPRRFAHAVERTLADSQGWGAPGVRAFRRVDEGPVAFRVTLAGPRTADRLCAPLRTLRIYSCFHAGRAVLNSGRWTEGAAGYRGRLAEYRRYMVNHEVGHGLGHGHARCPRRGARAPVMLQQTKDLGGCRRGPRPLASERGAGN